MTKTKVHWVSRNHCFAKFLRKFLKMLTIRRIGSNNISAFGKTVEIFVGPFGKQIWRTIATLGKLATHFSFGLGVKGCRERDLLGWRKMKKRIHG